MQLAALFWCISTSFDVLRPRPTFHQSKKQVDTQNPLFWDAYSLSYVDLTESNCPRLNWATHFLTIENEGTDPLWTFTTWKWIFIDDKPFKTKNFLTARYSNLSNSMKQHVYQYHIIKHLWARRRTFHLTLVWTRKTISEFFCRSTIEGER